MTTPGSRKEGRVKKFRVVMVCKEIWRAETTMEVPKGTSLEKVKDLAWARFDKISSKDLEQDNYTKVSEL